MLIVLSGTSQGKKVDLTLMTKAEVFAIIFLFLLLIL